MKHKSIYNQIQQPITPKAVDANKSLFLRIESLDPDKDLRGAVETIIWLREQESRFREKSCQLEKDIRELDEKRSVLGNHLAASYAKSSPSKPIQKELDWAEKQLTQKRKELRPLQESLRTALQRGNEREIWGKLFNWGSQLPENTAKLYNLLKEKGEDSYAGQMISALLGNYPYKQDAITNLCAIPESSTLLKDLVCAYIMGTITNLACFPEIRSSTASDFFFNLLQRMADSGRFRELSRAAEELARIEYAGRFGYGGYGIARRLQKEVVDCAIAELEKAEKPDLAAVVRKAAQENDTFRLVTPTWHPLYKA